MQIFTLIQHMQPVVEHIQQLSNVVDFSNVVHCAPCAASGSGAVSQYAPMGAGAVGAAAGFGGSSAENLFQNAVSEIADALKKGVKSQIEQEKGN